MSRPDRSDPKSERFDYGLLAGSLTRSALAVSGWCERKQAERSLGDPDVLCIVSDLATWMEALSAWITVTYDLTATVQTEARSHIARMLDALGRTDPLTQDQVHFVSPNVQRYSAERGQMPRYSQDSPSAPSSIETNS